MLTKPTLEQFTEVINKRYPHQKIHNIQKIKLWFKPEAYVVNFESGDYATFGIGRVDYLDKSFEWTITSALYKGRWKNKKTGKLLKVYHPAS